MNYRHQFHAGNFADVMKHALLVRLVRAMQRKDRGFLFLDTHAGRGGYNLLAGGRGDSLARQPEWPDGIGRLWKLGRPPDGLEEYRKIVKGFDAEKRARCGGRPPLAPGNAPRYYPGSPWIVRMMAREQDRLALCEKHPGEFEALAQEFRRVPKTSVHRMDGYLALRAMLPPPERRALVLIDAPFEAEKEFARISEALDEGTGRLPAGVFAVWYPLTERARIAEFHARLSGLGLPPTLAAELTVAAENPGLKMRGCGLLLVNPPWRFENEAAPLLEALATALAQEERGGSSLDWLVPQR